MRDDALAPARLDAASHVRRAVRLPARSRGLTWLLWLLFILTLPLPYFMIERGRVPAAQLFIFAAVTAPLVITDPNFTTRFVSALFLSQSLLYGSVLFIIARRAARMLAAQPRGRRLVAVAVMAVALLALSCFDVYIAPLSHGPGATNLRGVFF